MAGSQLVASPTETLWSDGYRSTVGSLGLRWAAQVSKAFLQASILPRARAAFWTRLVKPRLAWRDIGLVCLTEFGATIRCRSEDMIQRHIMFFGMWEPNVGHFIRARLKPGDLFVDVGANIGYFSLLASRCVGSDGAVVSIEASPSIFHILQTNISRNNCDNIDALNIAATGSSGTIQLYAAPGSNLGMTSTLQSRDYPPEAIIPCNRIFDILGPGRCAKVRLIKIDIEGAEWPVLKSILEDISRFSDTLEIIVEISPLEVLEFGTTAASIIETFGLFGFHPYGIENSYADYLRTRPIQRPRRLRSTPTSCLDVVFSRVDAEQI